MSELNVDRDKLKNLKKKLAKLEPRSERGVETLFRLLSKKPVHIKHNDRYKI